MGREMQFTPEGKLPMCGIHRLTSNASENSKGREMKDQGLDLVIEFIGNTKVTRPRIQTLFRSQ
jgi:hypothetical protein